MRFEHALLLSLCLAGALATTDPAICTTAPVWTNDPAPDADSPDPNMIKIENIGAWGAEVVDSTAAIVCKEGSNWFEAILKSTGGDTYTLSVDSFRWIDSCSGSS
jgi:hypothetical protein